MDLRAVLAAAVSLVCVAPQPCLATSSAVAVLRDFSYTLHDLDADDGVTPLLTWESAGGSHAEASASAPMAPLGLGTDTSFQLFSPVATGAGSGWASAQASVSGSMTTHSLTYQAGGQAGTSAQGLNGQYNARAELSFQPAYFTLSPHTRISLAGLADLVVTVDLAPGSTAGEQYAIAFVDLLVITDAGLQQSLTSLTTINGSESLNGTVLGLDVVNTSELPLTAYIELGAEVRGVGGGLSLVPEPSTAALAMAGLLAVGAAFMQIHSRRCPKA